jgi:acetyltransferase-like isoleucine patch superfamily enzyme
LRWSGISIGSSCLIMPGLIVARRGRVSFGNNVYINYNCYFDAESDIDIGDWVQIANDVKLITSTHIIGDECRRAGPAYGRSIKIGSGCWLGADVKVLPGVEIGRGCIIAAGAVVINNCLDNGLYAGVPAVRKKELN